MSEITFETAKAAAMPYINATCNFASSNWGAFKNVTVEYSTELYNSETVQYVVKTASSYLAKASSISPGK